ncbi:MAG: DNA repair protein [Clostridia bacterium]|nr:DNA repair protein [Clostridia bacterium]
MYLCIDLKSFFASVECVERGLDPLKTCLAVADPERGAGTLCLAITPALKALGIKNRCRVFEIPPFVKYIKAPPRMRLYIDYAARVYGVYIKYVSPDDVHVYSIDEAFLDVTNYLPYYKKTPLEMGKFLLSEVLRETGLYATCGVGTNLYLAKIALDITAKRSPDFMGFLNEELYRETIWDHTPLTDFWQIGPGTARRLAAHGIYTMRGVAGYDPKRLLKLFGRNAELLYDHAWGKESCLMPDIKAYRAKSHSLSSGQVLLRDYTFEEAEVIVREMADELCLDMTEKGLLCRGASLYISYTHTANLPGDGGSVSFPSPTRLSSVIVPGVLSIYRERTRRDTPIRRVNIALFDVCEDGGALQLSLFRDEREDRCLRLQTAVTALRKRYGKNALFHACDLLPHATLRERHGQIGGHKSGIQTDK